jgi:Na+/H+-dicarboxylate symporter
MVTSIASMKTRGAFLVGGIMLMVTISNFVSIMIPYFVGTLALPILGFTKIASIGSIQELQPFFDVDLEPLIKMELAMFIALIIGLGIGLSGTQKYDAFFERYMRYSQSFFEKIFIPLLPIYVVGTILKIVHETEFKSLLPIFGSVILIIAITQITYISFLYFIGAGRNFSRMLIAMKNTLQSSIVGFSTMSSVVTMPITLEAAEKNIEDPTVARVAITTTVNCHVIGECISLPMIALAIFFVINGHFPDLSTYFVFAAWVAIAQFSGVAVPGGSIVVILPFLIKYLGFSDEMCSMTIALSIFMDPIGTASNVFGNGAFAMIINRMFSFLSRTKERLGYSK